MLPTDFFNNFKRKIILLWFNLTLPKNACAQIDKNSIPSITGSDVTFAFF